MFLFLILSMLHFALVTSVPGEFLLPVKMPKIRSVPVTIIVITLLTNSFDKFEFLKFFFKGFYRNIHYKFINQLFYAFTGVTVYFVYLENN